MAGLDAGLSPSDKSLRSIIENAHDIIFAVSTDGTILSLNGAFETVTGWAVADWIGKPFQPLVDPETLSDALEAFQRACAGESVRSSTVRIFKKWGDKALIDSSLIPEFKDGRVVAIFGISRDITNQVDLEEQRRRLLHEENRRIEAEASRERALFLARASVSLFSSLEQDINAAFLAKLGASMEAGWCAVALKGSVDEPSHVAVAVSDADLDVWARQLEPLLLTTSTPLHPLLRALEKNETILERTVPFSVINDIAEQPEQRKILVKLGFFSVMAVPLVIRNTVIGAMMFASSSVDKTYGEDDLITAREFGLRSSLALENSRLYKEAVRAKLDLARARDEALRISDFKSEFVANVSHEIRTPINAIVGMASLLSNSSLTAQQQNFLEIIRISCDTLLSIINDILDMAKINAGRFELDVVEFNVRRLVEGVCDLLAPKASVKCLEFVCEIEPSLPSRIKGDAGRLRQILMNLGSNAVKFTPRGEVVISVQTQEETDTRITLRFTVRDTGIGLSTQQTGRIFEPFTQAEASTARLYGGSGLGLSISKMFAEAMGDTINVTSELGKGSSFSCDITFEKADAERDNQIPRDLRPNLFRILVADDNATARNVLIRQLRSWGFEKVTGVSNAVELLEQLRDSAKTKQLFHLVFIDQSLLSEPPFVVIREEMTRPPLTKTRLVALTPLHQPMVEKTMAELDISENLLKPVKSSSLIRCLMGEDRQIRAAISHFVKRLPVAGQRASILVAEDNSINQQVVQWQLKELGFRADTVGSGIEALEAISKQDYDLILMDCQMPEMNGFDATMRIRQRERDGRHTPIIALTAQTIKGIREKCLEAGMDECLIKPVTIEDLLTVFAKWKLTAAERPIRERHRGNFSDEILTMFLELTPIQLDSIRRHVQRKSYRALEMEAHRLAGSCSTLEFERMAELARRLEILASRRIGRGLPALMDSLTDEFAIVRERLQSTLKR